MISKKVSVLGVHIDQISCKEALNLVEEFLLDCNPRRIVTPNPEMIVLAQNHEAFLQALNSAELSLCDGKGIEFITRGKVTRLSGIDFMQKLCALAEQKQQTVFLLGTGIPEVLKAAKKELEKQYPKLNIVGTHPGIEIQLTDTGITLDNKQNTEIIRAVNHASPDMLFVAFGHGKQEIWMYKYLKLLTSVKVAMGIGGSLEFISKTIPRAPKWMQKVGLEWLYRLVQEPKRIKRICTAVIIFPFLYITDYAKKRTHK